MLHKAPKIFAVAAVLFVVGVLAHTASVRFGGPSLTGAIMGGMMSSPTSACQEQSGTCGTWEGNTSNWGTSCTCPMGSYQKITQEKMVGTASCKYSYCKLLPVSSASSCQEQGGTCGTYEENKSNWGTSCTCPAGNYTKETKEKAVGTATCKYSYCKQVPSSASAPNAGTPAMPASVSSAPSGFKCCLTQDKQNACVPNKENCPAGSTQRDATSYAEYYQCDTACFPPPASVSSAGPSNCNEGGQNDPACTCNPGQLKCVRKDSGFRCDAPADIWVGQICNGQEACQRPNGSMGWKTPGGQWCY